MKIWHLLTFFNCFKKYKPVRLTDLMLNNLLRWIFLTVRGWLWWKAWLCGVLLCLWMIVVYCVCTGGGVWCTLSWWCSVLCSTSPAGSLLLHSHCSFDMALNLTKPESNMDLKCFLVLSLPRWVCLFCDITISNTSNNHACCLFFISECWGELKVSQR